MKIAIKRDQIRVEDYPILQSSICDKITIQASEVKAINVNVHPAQVWLESNEIIFIEENHDSLKEFALLNEIELYHQNEIWNWIALPVVLGFDEQIFNYYEQLMKCGIEREMVDTVRFILSMVLDSKIEDTTYERHSIYNVLLKGQQCEFWSDRLDSLYWMIMRVATFQRQAVEMA